MTHSQLFFAITVHCCDFSERPKIRGVGKGSVNDMTKCQYFLGFLDISEKINYEPQNKT